MTPEQLAKSGTEEAEQIALFAWAALEAGKRPELRWLFHIPNGGARAGDKRTAMMRGARLKAAGVRAGVADLCLPVTRGGYSGLYVEMKKLSEKPKREGSRGGVSDEQLAFGQFVRSQHYGWIVCYGWHEAAQVIIQYLDQ